MSELALKRIREAKENRLTHLDLGKCGIKDKTPLVSFHTFPPLCSADSIPIILSSLFQ
jgi:hypothetical protein